MQVACGHDVPIDYVDCPRVAQRAALSAKGASQARSMLALFTGKGSEIPLPYGSRRVRKDAFKLDY